MEQHKDDDPYYQQHQQEQEPSFQEGVTEIMMACEELRQQIKADQDIPIAVVVGGREDMDLIFENLGGMHHQLHNDDNNSTANNNDEEEQQVRRDLFQHCQLRVAQVAQLFLERLLKSREPMEDDESKEQREEEHEQQAAQQKLETERRDFQASVARITELNFMLCLETGEHTKLTNLIEKYVAHQRKALRDRCKPPIARLAHDRKEKASNPTYDMLPHSHVVTAVLGQASALIHPLLAWLFSLPPPPEDPKDENKLVESIRQLCLDSVVILDEQAQTLTKTVSDWFWEDRKVDEWMAKSNAEDNYMEKEKDHKYFLGELDALVEEMAFVCQVLDRYKALIQDFPKPLQPTIEQQLSPEWTWKYATLERFLATQQWKSALMLATPVQILLGTSIQVPSVVEDAQYLSTRALERAASTRSTQAIGTVAHSISSHVWSTDISSGVHQALHEQIGCFVDESSATKPKQEEETQQSRTTASSNSFASALLDALDDDIGKDEKSSSSAPKKTPRPPASGPSSGLLSSLVGGGDALHQIRINTDFCNLNGIHSASVACRALVKFLDGLLVNPDSTDAQDNDSNDNPQKNATTNSMIQLAREELSQYGKAYEELLTAQVQHVIQQWCGSQSDPRKRKKGPCIPLVCQFFLNEFYELDSSGFTKAEADARLESELLGPLHESKFIQQLGDKCDAEVLFSIREELTVILVNLVLDCILNSEPPKRFTDWGSLLLSKEVRLLQTFLAKILENASSQNGSTPARSHSPATFQAWERLSQVVTVLQLERPSDWTLYQPTSVLTSNELKSAMQLRVDFSADAINTVVASAGGVENGQK